MGARLILKARNWLLIGVWHNFPLFRVRDSACCVINVDSGAVWAVREGWTFATSNETTGLHFCDSWAHDNTSTPLNMLYVGVSFTASAPKIWVEALSILQQTLNWSTVIIMGWSTLLSINSGIEFACGRLKITNSPKGSVNSCSGYYEHVNTRESVRSTCGQYNDEQKKKSTWVTRVRTGAKWSHTASNKRRVYKCEM